ncbi:hypothetical protein RUND412_003384 [Rhizina undulata]
MSVKGLLIILYLDLILPFALLGNIYLYFYPIFHFCGFHEQPSGELAPFRLLTLADPQIEGDSTLRRYHRLDDTDGLWGEVENVKQNFQWVRKTIDLWGNDLYLAHIVRSVKRHTHPTHVTALGDLVGSQWIDDAEFERRSSRFWHIFNGMEKVRTEQVIDGSANGEEWTKRVINIAGNHDVGYAGDMTRARVDRFEKAFGPVNYLLTIFPGNSTGDSVVGEDAGEVPGIEPTLRIVVLNSMSLDTPILDESLAEDSYNLLDEALKGKSLSPRQATVLLTHLPFYKPAGVCVDGPFFTYLPESHGRGIKEQNHLSDTTTELLLGWLFGLPTGGEEDVKAKERGFILTGHDHEGCDVRHYWDDTEGTGLWGNGQWNVSTWGNWIAREQNRKAAMEAAKRGEDGGVIEGVREGVREVTVRSMMGMYGGNAGLLSAWFDRDSDSWKFEYTTCALGTQHLWWVVHVIDLICFIYGLVLLALHTRDSARNEEKARKMQEELDRKQK